MMDHILKRVIEGTPEERVQAALELAELAMNSENLQHFTPEIMNSICSLVKLPIDDVSLVATQVVWTMTTFREIAEFMITSGVLPRLMGIFYSMGMMPLTEPIQATLQLNIVGALSRLTSMMSPKHSSNFMADIAAIMSVASTRNIDEALEKIEVRVGGEEARKREKKSVPVRARWHTVRANNIPFPSPSSSTPRCTKVTFLKRPTCTSTLLTASASSCQNSPTQGTS